MTVAQVVQTLIAIGAAGISLVALWWARHSAKSARRSADAAEASVVASQHTAFNERAARIDTQSPHFKIITTRPEWPPSSANPATDRAATQYPPDQRFRLPINGNQMVWFRSYVVITNTGPADAILDIPGIGTQHKFSTGADTRWGWPSTPEPDRHGDGQRWLLPADGSLAIACAFGRPAAYWGWG